MTSHSSHSASSGSSSSGLGSLKSLSQQALFNGTPAMYPTWRFNMMALLRMQHLHEVVLKPLPRKVKAAAAAAAAAKAKAQAADGAADQNDEEDKKAAAANDVQDAADVLWEEKADRAFGVLVLSFTSTTLSTLVRATVEEGDAHGVWTLLQKRYERNTTASQAHVLHETLNMALQENESIDAFVARLQTNAALLANMGETVTTSMQKYILLKGVPASYATLVQSLRLHQGKLEFDEIVAHLVDQEEHIKLKSGGNGRGAASLHDDVASYAQAAGPNNNGAHWQQAQRGRGRGGFRGNGSSGAGRGQNNGGGGGGGGNNYGGSNGSGGNGDGGEGRAWLQRGRLHLL